MEQVKWMYHCIGKGKKAFWMAQILGIISAGLFLCFPFITREITGMLPVDRSPTDLELEGIYQVLPKLLLILVFSQLLRSLCRYVMLITLERVSQDTIEEIRLTAYGNLSQQEDHFYHKHQVGDLMTRLTGDIESIRHGLAWLSHNMVESCTLFFFSICYFFTINTTLTMALLCLTPMIAVSSHVYSKSVKPLYSDLRESLSQMNSVTQENIAGNKTVRAFVREDYEIEQFNKTNEAYREANVRANRHWMKFFPVIEGFSQSLAVFTLGLGGYLIIQGEMNLADLAAFTLLSYGITDPMKNIGTYLNDFQRFLTSSEKVMELYQLKPSYEPQENPKTPTTEQGTIRFHKVSLQYPDSHQNTLEDISFTLNTGETLAIMGVTGAGKTSLLNLITRSVEATSGEIYVDGILVGDWDLLELRKRIAQATQKVALHSDSVHGNIAYGTPDLSRDKVETFAHKAAAQFVEDLPWQYDTIIGEMGMGLSGGQKQRIALARAFAKEAEFYILDDTTSAVDTETEAELRKNLNTLPKNASKILVAQRISAVKEADLILVLDKGRILQRGTHQELAHTKGFYQEICQLQGVM